MKKLRSSAIGAVAVISAVALAACGSSGSSKTSTGGSAGKPGAGKPPIKNIARQPKCGNTSQYATAASK